MELGIENKVIIITGATIESPKAPSGGIGAETARLLIEEGARVVLGDIDDARGQALADQLCAQGGEAVFAHTDVTREADVAGLVDAALEAFGTVDGLVTAAGCRAATGTARDFPTIKLEDWRFMMDAHLTGTFLCIQEVARQAMIPNRSGHIVTISSNAGHGRSGAHPFCVLMAAVPYLTKGVAAKLGPYGIYANCVSPGPVLTPIWEYEKMTPDEIEALETRLRDHYMVRTDRLGTGRDIARVIVLMLSDVSRQITAADINATAGVEVY